MAEQILVSSGKGGVGKTTVAAHLGAALARRGKRVLLVETDAGFRSLDLLFSLEETVVFDLADVLEGRCAPKDALLLHRGTGLRLLLAPGSAGFIPRREALAAFCRWADGGFDQVIFDGAAGFGPTQEILAQCCSLGIIVTLPDAAAARGGARVSGLLRAGGLERQRLVINRVPSGPPLSRGVRDLDDIIDTVGAQLLGAVPEERGLEQPGTPAGESPAREELDRIARRLLGEYVDLVIYR